MNLLAINLVILLFFMGSFSQAYPTCDRHSPTDSKVPLCPKDASVLSDIYPVKVAMVSAHMGGETYVTAFVREVLSVQSQNPPLIVISDKGKACESAQDFVRKNAPRDKKDAWLQSIICNKKSSWNWQQDFAQGYFDSKSGQPKVVFNSDYKTSSRTSQFDLVSQNDRSSPYLGLPEILKQCGISSQEKALGELDQNMAGNIEGFPPHFCVVGDSADKKWAETVCEGKNVFLAPTQFLKIGHVDEIVSTFPTDGKAPCNFKVLIADPSLGEELLKNEPDGPLLDLPLTAAAETCFEGGRRSQPIAPPRQKRKPNRGIAVFDNVLSKAWAAGVPINKSNPDVGKIYNSETYSPYLREFEKRFKDICPISQFLKGYRHQFGEVNKQYDQTLDQFATDITTKIKNQLPSCSDVVVRVPTLFRGTHEKRSALSFFPNPTNNISLNSQTIFSKQGVAAYDRFLASLSEKYQLKHRSIDTKFAQKFSGNLHCSSNLIRYCRPLSK